ncbi:BsuBI/PstI family type II restriction endonuclease [Escherichia coli]
MLQKLDVADSVRRELSPRTARKHKAEFGQFMTPSGVARFMASLFPPSTMKTCRLLDAGAGLGALSCAFLDRWLVGEFGFESVEATAYEIDKKLCGHLAKHLTGYRRVTPRIIEGDYIELATAEGLHIRAIIEDFAPRFAPGSVLVYAGDTGEKWGYFDAPLLAGLGVDVDSHGKMPDVVLHFTAKNWLLLVESVTSHGPVDGKRHAELARLFAGSTAGLVYVTAFPNRSIMGRYLGEIAWETEVWVADAPSHLIHFNGVRFLGPYSTE